MAQLIHGTCAGTGRIDLHIGRDKTDEPWAANLGYAVAELGAWGVGEEQKLLDSQDVDCVQALSHPHLRGETAFYECDPGLCHIDGSWAWVLLGGRFRCGMRTALNAYKKRLFVMFYLRLLLSK